MAAACDERVTATAVEHVPDVFSITAHPSRSKCPSGFSLLRSQRKRPWAAAVVELASSSAIEHCFLLCFIFLICSVQHQEAQGPRPCLRTPHASVIKLPIIIYSELHPGQNECAEVGRWKEGKKPFPDLFTSFQNVSL